MWRRLTHHAPSLVAAALFVGLGACGGDDGDPLAGVAPTEAPPVASTTSPVGTAHTATTAAGATNVPPPPATAPGADSPESVSCGLYYRPLGDAGIEGAIEDTVVLTMGSGSQTERSVPFDTMTFTAVAFGGDSAEGASISIAVRSHDDVPLTQVLYQLGSFDLADVQFVGGHGFTGLHYVDHLGAQLQFWCSAG
jgi:hypothetical protein